jgi:nucleoside-diphosphate-sugar epimerase
MRVFLAGATGAIGRPLVGQLTDAGNEVTGITRSPVRAAALEQAGAHAVVCDALLTEPLAGAVADAKPEVVIHQLTALPDRFEPRKKDLYEPTNQLRTAGTRNLLAAARAVGARRFVCHSIAFAYEPTGRAVKDERDPLFSEAAEPFGSAIAAVEEMEKAVLDAEGMEGLVLRYAWFYGPGTYFAEDGSTASDVRRRRFPIVSDGGGLFSFVHVGDAAAATVAALERGAPGTSNTVEDEPAPIREWLPHYAETLGAKPPRRVPRWAGTAPRREDGRRDVDRASRRLEREGPTRARLAAGVGTLARGLQAGAALREEPRRSSRCRFRVISIARPFAPSHPGWTSNGRAGPTCCDDCSARGSSNLLAGDRCGRWSFAPKPGTAGRGCSHLGRERKRRPSGA